MGSGNGEHKSSFVTNAELRDELKKVPTKWEVRFLILSAFIGGQVLPNIQFNQPVRTGLSAVGRLFF